MNASSDSGAIAPPSAAQEIATHAGFMIAIVSIAAPSYWAASLGLVANIVTCGVNQATRRRQHTLISSVGIGTSIIGFVVQLILRSAP